MKGVKLAYVEKENFKFSSCNKYVGWIMSDNSVGNGRKE